MKVIALGLLLGAAAVVASTHAPATMLSQNPIPTCSPDNPACTPQIQAQAKRHKK